MYPTISHMFSNAISHVSIVYSSLYVPQHHTSKYQYSQISRAYTERRIKYNSSTYRHKYTYARTHINFSVPTFIQIKFNCVLFCRNLNTNKREMTTWTTIAIRRNNTLYKKVRKEFHYWIRFVKRYKVVAIR